MIDRLAELGISVDCKTIYSDLGILREYRVDRMRDLRVLDDRAYRCKEATDYECQVRDLQYFGRFDGSLTKVTLLADEELTPAVYDHFDKDAIASVHQNDSITDVRVAVRVSPQSFGWVAGMGGHGCIGGPGKLIQKYEDYLNNLLHELRA